MAFEVHNNGNLWESNCGLELASLGSDENGFDMFTNIAGALPRNEFDIMQICISVKDFLSHWPRFAAATYMLV